MHKDLFEVIVLGSFCSRDCHLYSRFPFAFHVRICFFFHSILNSIYSAEAKISELSMACGATQFFSPHHSNVNPFTHIISPIHFVLNIIYGLLLWCSRVINIVRSKRFRFLIKPHGVMTWTNAAHFHVDTILAMCGITHLIFRASVN